MSMNITEVTTIDVILASCYLFYWLILEIDDAIYMEKCERILNPSSKDFQIQILSNGHIYMGCPEDDERILLLEQMCNESSYERGYYAYWEGLDFNEVSALQYKGWCDARDEVEKLPVEEVSQR